MTKPPKWIQLLVKGSDLLVEDSLEKHFLTLSRLRCIEHLRQCALGVELVHLAWSVRHLAGLFISLLSIHNSELSIVMISALFLGCRGASHIEIFSNLQLLLVASVLHLLLDDEIFLIVVLNASTEVALFTRS